MHCHSDPSNLCFGLCPLSNILVSCALSWSDCKYVEFQIFANPQHSLFVFILLYGYHEYNSSIISPITLLKNVSWWLNGCWIQMRVVYLNATMRSWTGTDKVEGLECFNLKLLLWHKEKNHSGHCHDFEYLSTSLCSVCLQLHSPFTFVSKYCILLFVLPLDLFDCQ